MSTTVIAGRTCAQEGCAEPLPAKASDKRRYCRTHSKEAFERIKAVWDAQAAERAERDAAFTAMFDEAISRGEKATEKQKGAGQVAFVVVRANKAFTNWLERTNAGIVSKASGGGYAVAMPSSLFAQAVADRLAVDLGQLNVSYRLTV